MLLYYNQACFKEHNETQGYSSAGRITVSKTAGRGFKSYCPCKKDERVLVFFHLIYYADNRI